MAAGDKVVGYPDQILADLHTSIQTLDVVVDEICTDADLILTALGEVVTLLEQLDFDANALVGIDGPHSYIHLGWAFSVHLPELAFAKNGEMGILLTTAAGTRRLHVTPLVSAADKSTFDILRNPTLDIGNYPSRFYTPRNRNENSDAVSIASSVRAVPVASEVSLIVDGDTTPISADGFTLHSEVIGGAKNKSAGEGLRDLTEYVLLAGATYYFRLKGDNTGTGALGAGMELTWYERETTLE